MDIKEYLTQDGKSIYADWLSSLRDRKARVKIITQVDRMTLGNFGDVKPVGEGISETRIDYGPGYRIYHAKEGDQVVVLLCGGDKSTQDKDIKLAKACWSDYKTRPNNAGGSKP